MNTHNSSIFQVIEPQETCIVYDAKTGKILHVHAVITLPGAADISKQQREKDALNFMQRDISEKQKKNLRMLWISGETLLFKEPQRVDLKKLSLVPSRKRSPKKKF